ncbi:MAG TPA: aldehyde dehydrogenase family protein, partial [Thermoanaerobaculia bacterium]|nr:aldehyde dehydrogenase family protein [Thermoanaerobaculia bacterium]
MEPLTMHIDGRRVESESGATFEATSPATGEVLAHVPEGTREDARRAVAAANRAKAAIAGMPVWERSKLLLRMADAIDARREELARTLSQDQGKPYHSEALWEVDHAALGFRN